MALSESRCASKVIQAINALNQDPKNPNPQSLWQAILSEIFKEIKQHAEVNTKIDPGQVLITPYPTPTMNAGTEKTKGAEGQAIS